MHIKKRKRLSRPEYSELFTARTGELVFVDQRRGLFCREFSYVPDALGIGLEVGSVDMKQAGALNGERCDSLRILFQKLSELHPLTVPGASPKLDHPSFFGGSWHQILLLSFTLYHLIKQHVDVSNFWGQRLCGLSC